MEVKEYEGGNHCFGEILRINGQEYEDIDPDVLKDFIFDMLEENTNKEHLLRELVKTSLEYLELDVVESDSSTCDQCGDYNFYTKYSK
jgi:hypothetical protein